ncbi:Rv3654c family TadE-like protein [Streptomyces sp. NPDC004647]|uniref:Rv3654c family TadE-like protein n=1 Tax=Streptomyces sp. NPDC004647 TaxID=3154671 RepID=UPI0033AC558D
MNASADRGSATVWTAVLATALCAVFTAVLGIGQAVVVRHRAGGAADLAALAAADHALEGQPAACATARRVAAAQNARVVRCAVTGEIADLTAEARAGLFTSRVRSRAGSAAVAPVSTPPGPRAPPTPRLSQPPEARPRGVW